LRTYARKKKKPRRFVTDSKKIINQVSRFLKRIFSNLRKRDFSELSLTLKKIEDIYPVEYNIKLSLRMKKASIGVYLI